MIIDLNEIKTTNRVLWTQIINELVEYQIECLLNHLEYDDYEYKTNVLELSDKEIEYYSSNPLQYLEDHYCQMLESDIETNGHIDYLNDTLELDLEDLEMDPESNDIIDNKTFEWLKNNL